jgi:hypothetical protein
MPIRPELRPLYPQHWRELSSHVRFERAEGRCQSCGRPHLALLRCLPDGRWFDEQAATWRDRRGRPARWPDLTEATRFRMTRVVLAAAHLDSDPDQQSAKESARALSTLPHAARSAAPFGAALDHLPPALGSRRSFPWPVPGVDRRADIETDVTRVDSSGPGIDELVAEGGVLVRFPVQYAARTRRAAHRNCGLNLPSPSNRRSGLWLA